MTPRICAIVPTYDNPLTVRQVVESLRLNLPDVFVVDDGSAEPGRRAVETLAHGGLARVIRRERNGGKGAAVKAGFRAAADLGFTHALQVDADGQHDLGDVPRFLAACRANPAALVLGRPIFDDSAPGVRRRGRLVSRFWTDLETGGRLIEDPLCGFRVYPLHSALRSLARANRMDFDAEVAVRMIWLGTPVVNLDTRVRYVPPQEGGVSHFRMVRDNLLISWSHARLFTLSVMRRLAGRRIRP